MRLSGAHWLGTVKGWNRTDGWPVRLEHLVRPSILAFLFFDQNNPIIIPAFRLGNVIPAPITKLNPTLKPILILSSLK
jgi:hypothetical protein